MKKTTIIKGNWEGLKGKLKQQFSVLTDDDLLFVEGKKAELTERLQLRLGKTKGEIDKMIGGI